MARNEGIAKARGKYIGFIDQDDWVKDQYIEILLNTAYKNNSDIVKCGYSDIDLKNQMRIWQNESIHIEKDEHEKFLHVNESSIENCGEKYVFQKDIGMRI